MSQLLRICDIVAFAPILAPHAILTETLTQEQFLAYAKLWRRDNVSGYWIGGGGGDVRTAELCDMVNALPNKEPDLELEEVVALMRLLYEIRIERPSTWKSFCESLKLAQLSFALAVSYFQIWAEATMPMHLCEALKRFQFVPTPHPVLAQFYDKCEGSKEYHAENRWPSIFVFNRALRDLFLLWRGAEVQITGVRLDPSHTELVMFPHGWTDGLNEMLLKIIKNV